MPRRNAVGVLTVVENLTLDGVIQAPGRCDEDVRDGFAHGGWAAPYSDPVMAETMGKGMAAPDVSPLVLGTGRRLFTDGAAFARLRLVECVPTTTGVLIANYRPADADQ
jgi:hypothetical protein